MTSLFKFFLDIKNENNRFFLWCALILSVLISCFFLLFDRSVSRDMIAYYEPMTRAFAQQDWDNAFIVTVPVLQSILAGLFHLFLPLSAACALMLVSCLFYIATIFPVYGICRKFFPPLWAGLGSFLFALAPVVIKTSCIGNLDAGKVFFLSVCIYMVFQFVERTCLIDYLLFAVALAGLAFSRGEGILFSILFILFSVVIYLISPQNKTPKRMLFLVFSVFVMFVILAPRLIQLREETGYYALDYRQAKMVLLKVSPMSSEENSMLLHERPANVSFEISPKETSYRFTWNKLLKDFLRGTFSLYLVFTIPGLFLAIKNRYLVLQSSILLITVIFSATIFSVICLAHRYFVLNIVCFMPFTLLGLQWVIRLIHRKISENFARVTTVGAFLLFIMLCLFDIGSSIYDGYYDVYYSAAKTCNQLPKSDLQGALFFCDDVRFSYFLNRNTQDLSFLEAMLQEKIEMKKVIVFCKKEKRDTILKQCGEQNITDIPFCGKKGRDLFMISQKNIDSDFTVNGMEK